MCERKSEQDRVEKVFIDEPCITKNSSKTFVARRLNNDDEQRIPLHVSSPIIYPKANLYYAFAEDTHAMTRVGAASKHLAKEKLLPHFVSHKDDTCVIRDFHPKDKAATDRYLKTDAPSFLIFGKPGSSNSDVASAIADTWNCILISPPSLIRREIDADTEKGRYIERNLRLGKCIGPEIIMNLIRCRIEMRDIGHRGYVIEGLPFIPNNTNFDYSPYSTYVSDTDCDNAEFCENAIYGETSETRTDRVSSSGENSFGGDFDCRVSFDYEREIPRQIDEIFTEWPKRPRIIIYIVCPKRDIVSRRARWRTETATGNIVDQHDVDGSNVSISFDEIGKVRDERKNYSLRRISDNRHNVETQCDLYERLALPVIDKWIVAHNPQYVIRADGRSCSRRILEILGTRLRVLPLRPSILPKRLIKPNDVNSNETFSELDALAKKSAREAFRVLRRREIVSSNFPWRLSAWNFYCPVELAQGRTVKGLSEYSVLFLGEIFFPSSQRAENLFVENPRTFLLSPNPRPTCKIAVFGPKYAGKSELCAQLAKILGGTVINVDRIDVKEKLIDRRKENEKDFDWKISPDRDEASIGEKFDIVARNIEAIPDEKLEGDLRRDGGYVVDGMDIEVWRKIVDNIVFEDVVVLFEDEPYVRLLDKFRAFFAIRPEESTYDDEYDEETDYYEEYETSYSYEEAEWEYLEHLGLFESERAEIERLAYEFGGNVIECNLANIEDLTEYVVSRIKLRLFDVATSAEEEEEEEEEDAETNTDEYLEDARIVDLETAERLLDCGYYFLSSFGRWCPVQVHANRIPVQMFLPLEARGQIFSVLHGSYIYFLAGEEALVAFTNDPSEFIARDVCLPILPLRISIIGPPKCGKTTLAKHFARTYGMRVISRGNALRGMLEHYGWTESARMIEDALRAGRIASIESVTSAIEMFSADARAASQGYILDDCPSDRTEAEQLVLLGMQPMIVLDLKADLRFCSECLSRDNDVDKRPPNFSVIFLSRRYANWRARQRNFRDWLKKFSRNVVELDATGSKWNVWARADRAVRSRFAEIMLYFREADSDAVHSLKYMCVSPFEFRSRSSRYESYCPLCLFLDNISRTTGDSSTESQGMVQFREYFYWICPRHMNAFVEDPLRYLPPVNTVASLPRERPRILKEIVNAEYVCWAQRLQFDGLCLVTYVDGLPDRVLTQGRVDLAVSFGDKLYLFCSEKCREKFLARHDKYSEVDITSLCELPAPIATETRPLPDLDFLEQTVTKTLIEAVNAVAARRPKIVGLSAAASAAIHIGVYLKTHGISKDSYEAEAHEIANRRMAGQDRIVKMATDTMKKRLNPYVNPLPKYFGV